MVVPRSGLVAHRRISGREIVPYEAGGAIASLNSATFHLLDFKSARLPMLGWAESAAYFEVVDDPKRVTALDYLFSQIQSNALDRERSIELIKQVAGRS
ncbi:Scr1 family TA system antitoxin-like transcriptional regulator [Nocardia tengchongensis]